MDHLWSPWRYQYVTKNTAAPKGGCIFCDKPAANLDEENLIVHRGVYNFVCLNLYPYSAGHVMIAPFAHVDSLAALPAQAAAELMALAQRTETILRSVYSPGGLNIGMNLGECAGAGVAGHIHLHMLPRWPGDANFMTVVAETRVHIEELSVTWRKLRDAFTSS
ncbi:MAG: HIT domain-containing protein [Acidobacteria bacterium]|nr:HIT domain-containing protein [Acidobacteriota bacterium]